MGATQTAATHSASISSGGFDEVILPLAPALRRAAQALTRDPVEANDLVQDALERALRAYDRFQPGTNARAWSMAILSRLFIDRWRQRHRQPRFVDIDGLDLPAPPDDGVQAEALKVWEGITTDDVKLAVGKLPPSLRRIFELSVFMRLSYSEVSAIVGIPSSTVGTRLLRARRRLRALLLMAKAGEGAAHARPPRATVAQSLWFEAAVTASGSAPPSLRPEPA
jgi:RNA polymerase sigma-70 factor, ECF subfamily